MALVYKYFTSTTRADVERCVELIDKAKGEGNNVAIYEAGETTPFAGKFGAPVAAGSEAPPGNLGVQLIEGIRLDVEAQDPHPNLTNTERAELLGYYALAEELQDDWYWNDGT